MATADPQAGAHVTYSQQFRRCGKAACPVCSGGGPGHGPYWYAYWREAGRLRSRYIGKQLPPAAGPQQAQASVAAPDSGEQLCPPLRVRTLGSFAVWRGDAQIDAHAWTRHKVAALFKCLISVQNQRVHRERVMESLWPTAEPSVGSTNLRLTMHRLRRTLCGAGYLRLEHEMLVLVPSPEGRAPPGWLDAAAFEEAAVAAMAEHDVALCRRARSLYTGDFLPDDPYDEWAIARREELQRRYEALLLHQAGLLERQDAIGEAIDCLKAVMALDSTHEEAARALMRLQSAGGHHTEAIRTYRKLADTLRRDLRIAPDGQTQDLYRALMAGRRPAGQSPAAGPAGRARSPVQPPLDVLGAQPAMTLLGRSAEVSTLVRFLERAFAGQGSLVLLRGAAGVGKSRLLRELIHKAHGRGALVLLGRAYRQEGQLPYGPLQEALHAYASAQTDALLATQMTFLSVLVRLVPDLARRLPAMPVPSPLEPGAERHRLFAALAGLLAALGRTTPLLLALEDLHWADKTTLQALHYLHRTCRAVPLLIVGTYRPEEFNASAVERVLGGTTGNVESGCLLDVEPLAHEAGTALVGALLAPEPVGIPTANTIVTWAQGNPLFVAELVATLRLQRRLLLLDGRWRLGPPELEPAESSITVPESIQTLIVEQVERLDRPAVQLLRRCAVLGGELPYTLLCQISDLPEDRLLDALEVALASRVLVETTLGGQPGYAFRHPLIREALYQAIPARRRTLLHGQVGDSLASFYEGRAVEHAAELAWHFGQAGADDQAASYAVTAGDMAAAAYAAPEAISHYVAARRHLEMCTHAGNADGGASARERSRIDEKLGDMRLLIGAYAEAREDFVRARSAETNPERRVDLWCKEGDAWLRLGDYDQALHAYATAEDELDRPAGPRSGQDDTGQPIVPASSRAALELCRSEVYQQRWDLDAVSASATYALKLLENEPVGPLQARAHHLLAVAAMWKSDHPRAESHFRQSLSMWERLGNQLGMAVVWNSLGLEAFDCDDFPRAEECYRRCLTISARIGEQRVMGVTRGNLGNIAVYRGDFAAAKAQYLEARAILERIGAQGLIAAPMRSLAYVAEMQGSFAQAEAGYEQGLALHERLDNKGAGGWSWKGLANVALARGDLDRAESCYRHALDLLEPTGMQSFIAEAWIGLGQVALERGDPATAISLLRRARRIGQSLGAPRIETQAALCAAAAYLARAQGKARHDREVRCTCALLARGRSMAGEHDLFEPALHGLLIQAELLLWQGEAQEARAAAAEALQKAVHAGMRRHEALAQHMIGRCAWASGAQKDAEAALRAALATQVEIAAALDAARSRLLLAEIESHAGNGRRPAPARGTPKAVFSA